MEERYLAERDASARRPRAWFGVFSAVVWAAFSVWDYQFVPAHFGTMALLRHGIGTASLLAGSVAVLLAPRTWTRWGDHVSAITGACVLASTLAMHAMFMRELWEVLFAGLSIIVLLQHSLTTSRAVVMAPGTLLSVAVYLALAIHKGMPAPAIANNGTWLVTAELLALFVNHAIERLTRTAWAQRQVIARERARSDELLLNILPATIAARLKAGESPIADRIDSVTVVFGDIVGFTALSQRMAPEQLVAMLDEIFRDLDVVAAAYGLEKIKTIGDAYMAVAGLDGRPDHAARAADAALEMRQVLRRFEGEGGIRLRMRVGLHVGPVVAGVIGSRKFSYDVWGDTVNTASRMESHGVEDQIHVSDDVAQALQGSFELVSRGELAVKGKGAMRTWLLERRTPA